MKTPEQAAEEYATKYVGGPALNLEYMREEDCEWCAGWRNVKETFLAGIAWGRANPEWVKCSESMPGIGEFVVLYFKTKCGWSWAAGNVDGSDEGLFVDFEWDGQPITTNDYWRSFSFTPPEIEDETNR